MLCFDIETGPRPEDELRATVPPFDPSTVRGIVAGEFDPSTVKLGNLKDQNKINEKLDQAKADFEAAKANADKLLADAERSYWSSIIDKAALSPVTGHVLAVGFHNSETDKFGIVGADKPADEPKLLREFWKKYLSSRSSKQVQHGFNIFRFDLPFIVRRSWLLKVDVPATFMAPGGRYFDPAVFVDLMVRWQCGGGWGDTISLGELAGYFGVGAKPDGVNGADFARLWRDDRQQAVAYLQNDLRMTAACGACMGLI